METTKDPREVRRAARQAGRTAAAKLVDERAQQTAMSNDAAERRMANSQPTPTQRENDLAKVGALDIDDKEDDGSGPEPAPAVTRQMAPAGPAPYSTRAAAPAPAPSPAPASPSSADKK